MNGRIFALAALCGLAPVGAWATCPYDVNCLDNPYGGRDDSALPFNPAPYGRGQLGAAFGANPLRGGSANDPYAPAARSDEEPPPRDAAPTPGGLGLGSAATPGGLQGVDPDQSK